MASHRLVLIRPFLCVHTASGLYRLSDQVSYSLNPKPETLNACLLLNLHHVALKFRSMQGECCNQSQQGPNSVVINAARIVFHGYAVPPCRVSGIAFRCGSFGHRLRVVQGCREGLVQGRVDSDWNAQEWMELDPYQCIASRLRPNSRCPSLKELS